MKKNIKVKEKELIDKLNKNVGRWDNHGPVQFEEDAQDVHMDVAAEDSDKAVTTVIDKETGNVVDVKLGEKTNSHRHTLDERYFSGKTIDEGAVTLTPRDSEGCMVDDITDWDDDLKCHEECRKAVSAGPGIVVPKMAEMNPDFNKKPRMWSRDELTQLISEMLPNEQNIGTRLRTHEQGQPVPEVETGKCEMVNHPKHYNSYDVEVIDMMERVFGREAVITFCKLNAFKYRMRAGLKGDNSIDQDLRKERWYLDKANELANN